MRLLRKAKNLTLDGLQKQTGIPLTRLRSVDAGEKPPYLSEAMRIADALGTTMDALARGTVTTRMSGAFRNAARHLPTNNIQIEGESETNEILDQRN